MVNDEATELLISSPPPLSAKKLGESPSITISQCTDTRDSLGCCLDDVSMPLNAGGLVEDAEDAWEDVLEEQERGGVEIRGWDELREQVKDDLAKGAKTGLPLSRVNQLMLIQSFATLHLKGLGCVEASLEIFISGMKARANILHERLGHLLVITKCSNSFLRKSVEDEQML